MEIIREREITFSIQYKTNFGENICVVGDGVLFGNWVPSKGLLLKWNENHIWSVVFKFPEELKQIVYKYAVINAYSNSVHWENSKNREVIPNPDNKPLTLADEWEQTNWQIELEIRGRKPAAPAPRREAPQLIGDKLDYIRHEINTQAELIRKMRDSESFEGSLSSHTGKDKILEQVTKLLELKYLDPANWPRDKVTEDAKVPVIKARWKIKEPNGNIIRLQIPFIGVTHIEAFKLAQFIQSISQHKYPNIGYLKNLHVIESKTKKYPVLPGDNLTLPLIFPGPVFKSLYVLKLDTEWTGKTENTHKTFWGYANY